MAQCCNPKEGDKIVGAIGQGMVTIHQFECINLEKVNLDRRIPANWSTDKSDGMMITISCTMRDRKGILRELTEIFYQMELNIEDIQIQHMGKNFRSNMITLRSDDEDYYIYERIVERIRFGIPEIVDISLISVH